MLAVKRRGPGGRQPLKLLLLECKLALFELVLMQHRAIRIDDDDIPRAVDDDQFVVAYESSRVVRCDDCRDIQAARHDRGVRGHPSEIGEKGREMMALELDDVGRREVVRN